MVFVITYSTFFNRTLIETIEVYKLLVFEFIKVLQVVQ